MTVRALAAGATAGITSVLALRLLRDTPPGGAGLWDRTNHAGEPVTLLEGPAFVLGASLAATAAGPGPAVAALGAGALGALDDLAGDSSSKGLRGHLTALAHGELTTGAVKILGLAVTGLVSAALVDRPRAGGARALGAVDTLVAGAVVAGAANLLNLLDLRPGRALKATVIAGALTAADPRAAAAPPAAPRQPPRQPVLPSGCSGRTWPARPCSATPAPTAPAPCWAPPWWPGRAAGGGWWP